MTSKQRAFLNQRTLPLKITAQQMGWLLGFSALNIRDLVKADLLKPLVSGRAMQFSSRLGQRLVEDLKWMDNATDAAEAARSARIRKRRRNLSSSRRIPKNNSTS
jgi:hypothetical protein